jgi:hypothetical protein
MSQLKRGRSHARPRGIVSRTRDELVKRATAVRDDFSLDRVPFPPSLIRRLSGKHLDALELAFEDEPGWVAIDVCSTYTGINFDFMEKPERATRVCQKLRTVPAQWVPLVFLLVAEIYILHTDKHFALSADAQKRAVKWVNRVRQRLERLSDLLVEGNQIQIPQTMAALRESGLPEALKLAHEELEDWEKKTSDDPDSLRRLFYPDLPKRTRDANPREKRVTIVLASVLEHSCKLSERAAARWIVDCLGLLDVSLVVDPVRGAAGAYESFRAKLNVWRNVNPKKKPL